MSGMLGFGYYVWDKRCPSGRRCAPPIYGNFNSTYIKVPTNSPRVTGGDQQEATAVTAAPWQAGIPRGNDICIKSSFTTGKVEVSLLKKRSLLPQNEQQRSNHGRSPHNHHPPRNEIFTRSGGGGGRSTKSSYNSPSYFPPATSNSLTECNDYGKTKQFYNVMWNPRVVRGPTLLHYEEAQRAKWKRQVDSDRLKQLQEQLRRRRKRMKEEKYLNTKSNPMRRILYPAVTIEKEPLTNSSFDLFLTEQQAEKPVQWVNMAQVTDEPGPDPPEQKVKPYLCGVSIGMQTDGNKKRGQRQETVDFITSTMTAKIPEQAVLEVAEEAETEILRGEVKRHELVFLFRKWQEAKERQWNEYLRAWNELRMREILDQNAYLEDQQKRLGVIGFCRNVVNSCFEATSEALKLDGFFTELGISHEEFEELKQSMDYQSEIIENKLARKQLLARKVVDSTLINAAVHRFSAHMFDAYGRPHGTWLHKRARRSSVDFDMELEQYLESRWINRREATEEGSVNALYSETELLNIFDFYKNDLETSGGVRSTLKGKKSELPNAFVMENLISKDRLGRKTVKGTDKRRTEHHSDPGPTFSDDDVSMLYKRHTRWSKLEKDDEHHHHHHHPFEQNKPSHKKGSRLSPPVAKGNETMSKYSDHTGGVRFSKGREEVDSDKLGETSGSEKGRNKVSPNSEKQAGASKLERNFSGNSDLF